MDQSIMDMLREKYPGAFEEWDGFEHSFQGRQRQGAEPEMLVILYNKGEEHVVDLHAAFLLTSDEDMQDVVRVGESNLVEEYHNAYVPHIEPEPRKRKRKRKK